MDEDAAIDSVTREVLQCISHITTQIGIAALMSALGNVLVAVHDSGDIALVESVEGGMEALFEHVRDPQRMPDDESPVQIVTEKGMH